MPRIATRSGAIGFTEQGHGGVPIVFLHGVGSDKSVWDPQLTGFGSSRRAVAFDYPGYGESAPAEPATSRDDYAAALLAAMDALGIERAHICGLSLGGVVAIAMHDAAPRRCSSLIIADSFAVHPDGQAIYSRGLEASRTIGMRALAAARAPLLLGAGAGDAIRARVVETMAGISSDAFAIGLEAVWLADQRDRVARIAVPTLVIVGEEDKITPPALSVELAQAIEGARLHRIEGAGHLANIERPDLFNRLVGDFVESIEASGQFAPAR